MERIHSKILQVLISSLSYFETAQTSNMSRLSYFKNSSKWRKFTQIYSKILQVLISISSYFNKAQTSNMSRLSYFKNSSKWRYSYLIRLNIAPLGYIPIGPFQKYLNWEIFWFNLEPKKFFFILFKISQSGDFPIELF